MKPFAQQVFGKSGSLINVPVNPIWNLILVDVDYGENLSSEENVLQILFTESTNGKLRVRLEWGMGGVSFSDELLITPNIVTAIPMRGSWLRVTAISVEQDGGGPNSSYHVQAGISIGNIESSPLFVAHLSIFPGVSNILTFGKQNLIVGTTIDCIPSIAKEMLICPYYSQPTTIIENNTGDMIMQIAPGENSGWIPLVGTYLYEIKNTELVVCYFDVFVKLLS
jgi:hypothetical protein